MASQHDRLSANPPPWMLSGDLGRWLAGAVGSVLGLWLALWLVGLAQ